MTERSYICSVKNNIMSKGELTRQLIIERSAPIFNTKGIAATAMSDIMEATKLSKGSLYVHFENKEELAAAVVDYNIELLNKKVFAAIDKAKSAKEKLFAYIDLYASVHNPPVTGGCPMINFGMEADDTNPVINQKIKKGIENAQKLVADIISHGIDKGEFKSDWNFEEFATIMFAMLEGGVVIARVSGNDNKTRIIEKNLKQMISDHIN